MSQQYLWNFFYYNSPVFSNAIEEIGKIRYATKVIIFRITVRWCQLCGKILKTLPSKAMC